jgi:hypothetical protein
LASNKALESGKIIEEAEGEEDVNERDKYHGKLMDSD